MRLTRTGHSEIYELLKEAQQHLLDPHLYETEPQETISPEEQAEMEYKPTVQDPTEMLDRLLSRVQNAIENNMPVDLRIIESDLLELKSLIGGPEEPEMGVE